MKRVVILLLFLALIMPMTGQAMELEAFQNLVQQLRKEAPLLVELHPEIPESFRLKVEQLVSITSIEINGRTSFADFTWAPRVLQHPEINQELVRKVLLNELLDTLTLVGDELRHDGKNPRSPEKIRFAFDALKKRVRLLGDLPNPVPWDGPPPSMFFQFVPLEPDAKILSVRGSVGSYGWGRNPRSTPLPVHGTIQPSYPAYPVAGTGKMTGTSSGTVRPVLVFVASAPNAPLVTVHNPPRVPHLPRTVAPPVQPTRPSWPSLPVTPTSPSRPLPGVSGTTLPSIPLPSLPVPSRFPGMNSPLPDVTTPKSTTTGDPLSFKFLAFVVFGIMLLIVLLSISFYMFRAMRAVKKELAESNPEAQGFAATVLSSHISEAKSLFDQAKEAALQGDYRAGIRLMTLATLLLLERRDLLGFEETLTNGELLQHLRGNQDIRKLLAQPLRLFDIFIYSSASPGKDDFQVFVRLYETLIKQA